MNEETVTALAEAVGLPLPADRRAGVAELLETLVDDGGGATAEEVAALEPATAFDPRWPQ